MIECIVSRYSQYLNLLNCTPKTSVVNLSSNPALLQQKSNIKETKVIHQSGVLCQYKKISLNNYYL